MTSDYDLPAFHFLIEWNGCRCLFPAIQGLDCAGRNTDDMHTELSFDEQKLKASKTVLLKHGIIIAGTAFEKWLQQSRLNAVDNKQYDLQVSLVNEIGEILLRWHLINVMPASIMIDHDLTNSGNIAVTEARLSYETIDYLPIR